MVILSHKVEKHSVKRIDTLSVMAGCTADCHSQGEYLPQNSSSNASDDSSETRNDYLFSEIT